MSADLGLQNGRANAPVGMQFCMPEGIGLWNYRQV
jgi:hypothetical protein